MPIVTKKRMVKRSRRGVMSCKAWWLYSDWLSTMPARNAPKAKGSPMR